MTFITQESFAFLTCIAFVLVFHCKADGLPPPTELSYKWLDNFTVELSWKMPSGLPDDGSIKFLVEVNKGDGNKGDVRTSVTHFTDTLLTEEKGSNNWTYNIWTVSDGDLKGIPANITIKTIKPRAEVVKDFKCLLYNSEGKLNCSWIPAHQPLNMRLFYRLCGKKDEDIANIKKCDQTYSSGERNGCYIDVGSRKVTPKICILVETDAEMSTFKPKLGLPRPKLNITEKGDQLILSWTPPVYGNKECYIYEFCYKQCNKLEPCRNVSHGANAVPYDKRCRYEFQHRVTTKGRCPSLSSDTETVQYGTNDWTLTVVAIIIPIILSACVILSCYCFRRHSAIICPIIPDPSTILKEMMMNGNKELKTTTWSLYTPVPEPVEPCNITPMTESSVPQQNY